MYHSKVELSRWYRHVVFDGLPSQDSFGGRLQTCANFVVSLTGMPPFLAKSLIECLPLFVFA